jgi:hypothetical protein
VSLPSTFAGEAPRHVPGLVCGTNGGENVIEPEGTSQGEAWWRACQQAAAVGMLAPARPEAG